MPELGPLHLVALLGGYLIGSIPFGLVLTRLAGLGDIRDIGSGNIGATNVLRTGNKPLALATLLLDSGKGAAAALLLSSFDPLAGLIAGGGAILGHNFPVWLKFKGGKGVATTLGVLIAVAWPVGLGACATWLLAAAIFRYSSLSALIALAASPFYAWWMNAPDVAILAALLAILSIIRHHENISRLIKGEESKIGKKKA
ncbi:MAG: glycerol-3-phosphate 1-O-acyltransferase PlsY [Rhodospirillaceae bacterium]|jgi:acyl phosphate:glycerol-3-phosphate acyltransferase|nr:glycerol-3-phosphate 1-O-acyltransferase PlsY [Rhodospirillaceae bacterium]MBT5245751.1 glycerol-3-phosphate 1-O-acyltransferase PlsY [Rhodospirillaceae bacterium]MBT5561459.1 glycerol-3-phosphate 1-O-acyltransferase PlsY [Rhodospirillaceae bacterium]MBT6242941.1 glycerol-3-phosphate 1-O-acyltransferase PlsY [Rhodospirillaceae bacterium]MBT7138061.1 glycerol-3-phosphate 1-O-acyltransferase PlsY [Rhodospirillaceae bacterium]